ncbi:hypothetical protein [Sphingomonas nostoxanthinifaciens]|uniref:hypothetical protein n=1 Tax=Sphingomonas nostoxanthinifaciens TaxID=2872652 RepID=UPI001CC20DA1|nr:hypothetical protein [Sphingomonas nostoxanthinifaciens]UAK22856.1 hypothetical protein K8P63_10405 [Sphingomonas nostoxanthinifaciens]
MNKHTALSVLVFAGAASITRFTFQHFATRWQMILFWLAAALYQFVVRPVRHESISAVNFALTGVAAMMAIWMVRIVTEGRI